MATPHERLKARLVKGRVDTSDQGMETFASLVVEVLADYSRMSALAKLALEMHKLRHPPSGG